MSFNQLLQQLKARGNWGHEGRPGKIGGSAPGSGGGGYVQTPMDTKTINAIKSMATEDYQKRGGGYPRSGVPDFISVYDYADSMKVHAEFKNTSEKSAESWMRTQMQTKIGDRATVGEYDIYQSGDYNDDWVTVTATFKK